MISTVTTSTVSTITTTTLAGAVALVGILVLLILLAQKELASSIFGRRLQILAKVINIGIIPLLIAFIMVVFTRMIVILH